MCGFSRNNKNIFGAIKLLVLYMTHEKTCIVSLDVHFPLTNKLRN